MNISNLLILGTLLITFSFLHDEIKDLKKHTRCIEKDVAVIKAVIMQIMKENKG